MRTIDWKEVDRAASHCALAIIDQRTRRWGDQDDREVARTEKFLLYGIPRGGTYAALAVLRHLPAGFELTDDPAQASILIDDLVDSGATRQRWLEKYPGKRFFTLFARLKDEPWLVFPWDMGDAGAGNASGDDIVLRLLQYIGEDPTRGGLRETPKRVLGAWREWTRGYGMSPDDVLKTFEDGAEQYNELVLVRNIPVYSHCEHHLAPFFGVAHVGYIPSGKIVGLSKLNRLVDVFARRLQVQERLTNQIAAALQANLNPQGVGVVLQCRHLCMESRGVCQQGHTTTTSAMLGAFFDEPAARAEFLGLIKE